MEDITAIKIERGNKTVTLDVEKLHLIEDYKIYNLSDRHPNLIVYKKGKKIPLKNILFPDFKFRKIEFLNGDYFDYRSCNITLANDDISLSRSQLVQLKQERRTVRDKISLLYDNGVFHGPQIKQLHEAETRLNRRLENNHAL